jgi:hypothetical protein
VLNEEKRVDCPLDPSKTPQRARKRECNGPYMYMTVGRQHNERLNTPTNRKRRTVTSRTHADILPGLRVIQYTYPLIEASRTLHHVTSLDDRRSASRVQSFPNRGRGDVCMCSRCLCSSLWIFQSVQSLVMLSAYCHVYRDR